MVTLNQLVERAFEQNNLTGKYNLEREAIEPIIRETIAGLGFHIVEATGEVGDPRPKPHVEFSYDRNVRYSGGPGRKRR